MEGKRRRSLEVDGCRVVLATCVERNNWRARSKMCQCSAGDYCSLPPAPPPPVCRREKCRKEKKEEEEEKKKTVTAVSERTSGLIRVSAPLFCFVLFLSACKGILCITTRTPTPWLSYVVDVTQKNGRKNVICAQGKTLRIGADANCELFLNELPHYTRVLILFFSFCFFVLFFFPLF